MKRLGIILIAGLLACALCGCVQITVQKGSNSTSEGSSGTATTSSSAASSTGSPTLSSSASPTSTSEPRYEMSTAYLDVYDRGDGVVVADAAMQITNTGSSSFQITGSHLVVLGETGSEVTHTADGENYATPIYLDPTQTAFIYTREPMELPGGYFPGFNYTLQAYVDTQPLTTEIVEYPVSNVQLIDDGKPTLKGTVKNNTEKTSGTIEISVVYTDNGGNIVGVADQVVKDLAPGASQDFMIPAQALPTACTMAVVSGHDIVALGLDP